MTLTEEVIRRRRDHDRATEALNMIVVIIVRQKMEPERTKLRLPANRIASILRAITQGTGAVFDASTRERIEDALSDIEPGVATVLLPIADTDELIEAFYLTEMPS